MSEDFEKSDFDKSVPSLRDILDQTLNNTNGKMDQHLNRLNELIMEEAIEAAKKGCIDFHFLLIYPQSFSIGTNDFDTDYLTNHFQKLSNDHFYDVEIHHQDYVSFDWTSNDVKEYDSSISDVSHTPHNSPQLENGKLYAVIDYECDEDDYISVLHNALTFCESGYNDTPLFYIGEPDYCEFDYDDNCGCSVDCNCDDDDYCECESDCECTDASFGDWNFISQGDSISTDEKVLPGYRKLPIRVLDSEGVLSSVSKRKRKFIEDNSYNSLLMCFELTPE